MKYKKPITPLLLHEDAETPFQLENRQHIDFTGNFKTAFAKLRKHILWLDTPEGKLNALKARLADARRDLRRTEDPVKQKRIQAEIEVLKQQIADQKQIVEDPEAAKKRVEESIATGVVRERQPKKPSRFQTSRGAGRLRIAALSRQGPRPLLHWLSLLC